MITTNMTYQAVSEQIKKPSPHCACDDRKDEFEENTPNNSQINSLISTNDQAIRKQLTSQLAQDAKAHEMEFVASLQSLPVEEQFIMTMQRWAMQCAEAQSDLKWIMSIGQKTDENEQAFDAMRIPIGSYIRSEKLGRYYLNLGVETRTLQGALYICKEFTPCMMTQAMQSDGTFNFSQLIQNYAAQPTLAIKYYDRNCCNMGVTLRGLRVKEKAVSEIKMTRSIYQNAKLCKSVLSWLPEPHRNVIRYYEHWTDEDRQCYFLCTEYANAGELLLFIDSYHDIVYMTKKKRMEDIQNVRNAAVQSIQHKGMYMFCFAIKHNFMLMIVYRESLQLSADGQNAYIEFARFLFQQMVQSIYTIHCQGIAHLDVSCENFVLHYDADGQFLVKLIDFGRATQYPRKQNEDDKEYRHEYQKFDFLTSTYPGKCRYMSPESSLFLKYRDAEPFDASKEDVYALGVVLYIMLTCSLPVDSPFFIVPDENEPSMYGYLNGSKKCKINLKTMTDANNPMIRIDANSLDAKAIFLQTHGVGALLQNLCLIDYVSPEALDLLQRIFSKRMSLEELIRHPFVAKPSNPELLISMIRHVVDFKKILFAQQQEQVKKAAKEIQKLHTQRFDIQATAALLSSKVEQQQQQQQNDQLSDSAEQESLYPSEFQTSSSENGFSTSTDVMYSQSLASSLSLEMDFAAYHLDYSLPEDGALFEPSPPPNPDYAVCPSPDAQFSPSPEPTMGQPDFGPSKSNSNVCHDSSTDDEQFSSAIHGVLSSHFDFEDE